MPSSVTYVALVGHAFAQGASSQCMHWTGTTSVFTCGYVPLSESRKWMKASVGTRPFYRWHDTRQV